MGEKDEKCLFIAQEEEVDGDATRSGPDYRQPVRSPIYPIRRTEVRVCVCVCVCVFCLHRDKTV